MFTILYKSVRSSQLQELAEYRSGSLVVVENATESDLHKVAELTGLQFADLHDILDVYEMPRFERQSEGVLVFLRHPSSAQTVASLATEVLTIVLTPKHLVLLSRQENLVLQEYLSQAANIATTQRTKIILHLFHIIAKRYTKEVKKVSDDVLRQKRELSSVRDKDITLLVKNEDILNQYLAALLPIKHVLEVITYGKVLELYEDDSDLLEDVILSINQSVNICEVNLKTITALREAYQIIFTNKLNATMKFLTSFTIIVTIPNIIAGLFGMNVSLPLMENPWAFWLIIQMIFVTCFVMGWVFYKQRWL